MGTPSKEAAMQYALLIYSKPDMYDALSPEDYQEVHSEYMALAEVPGMVGGEQLQSAETATTIRADGSQTLTTDGPFADTKEIFAGFYLYQAADIDAALAVAARIPAVRLGGAVEVRPIVEMQS
ncbi:MAG TPA: YciI family protein [Solirubrobacteraceae bacterium]|jgi:hypothetical protein|nr:YciI family protein [Solirubrobacteraceae bacterium]